MTAERKCDVCGLAVSTDDGIAVGRVFAHSRHRYFVLAVDNDRFHIPQLPARTDAEIESLASSFHAGELAEGWE